MRGVFVAVIAASLFAAFVFACVGDDAVRGIDPGGTDSGDVAGAEGQACFANLTCNTGLTCISKVCVSLDAGGPGPSDSGVDAPTDAGGGDAHDGAIPFTGISPTCPTGGSVGDGGISTTDQGFLYGLAVDCTSVYWASSRGGADGGAVWKCPYDQAIARAPQLRACAETVPDPPAPVMPQPWLLEEPSDLEFRSAVDARLSLFGETRLQRWGDYGYVARFGLADFQCVFFTGLLTSDRTVFLYTSHLRATVPEALERLEVRLQGTHHTVAKAVGLAREIETGDAPFDAAFWVKGAAPTAALLTPPVRKALLQMLDMRPVLIVEGGLVTLEWTITWKNIGNDSVATPAVEAMTAIRAAIAS